MYLHDAMMLILKEYNRPMTGEELSNEIYRRGLYFQKSGGQAPRSQIELRAKNYPQYFYVDKSCTPRLISIVE